VCLIEVVEGKGERALVFQIKAGMSKTKPCQRHDVRVVLPEERPLALPLPICDCVNNWVSLLFLLFFGHM